MDTRYKSKRFRKLSIWCCQIIGFKIKISIENNNNRLLLTTAVAATVSITSFKEVDGLYGQISLQRLPVPPVAPGVVVAPIVLVVPVPPSVLVPVLIPPSVPVASQPLLHLHPLLCHPQTHFHPPLCKVLAHAHPPLSHGLPES